MQAASSFEDKPKVVDIWRSWNQASGRGSTAVRQSREIFWQESFDRFLRGLFNTEKLILQ
jgi:hypothetical protein